MWNYVMINLRASSNDAEQFVNWLKQMFIVTRQIEKRKKKFLSFFEYKMHQAFVNCVTNSNYVFFKFSCSFELGIQNREKKSFRSLL